MSPPTTTTRAIAGAGAGIALDVVETEVRRRVADVERCGCPDGDKFHAGARAAYLDLLRWVRAERLKLGG